MRIFKEKNDVIVITESIGAELVYQLPSASQKNITRMIALAPTYNPAHLVPSFSTHIVTPFDFISPLATFFLWPWECIKLSWKRNNAERLYTWILRHDRFYPHKSIFLTQSKSLMEVVKDIIEKDQ